MIGLLSCLQAKRFDHIPCHPCCPLMPPRTRQQSRRTKAQLQPLPEELPSTPPAHLLPPPPPPSPSVMVNAPPYAPAPLPYANGLVPYPGPPSYPPFSSFQAPHLQVAHGASIGTAHIPLWGYIPNQAPPLIPNLVPNLVATQAQNDTTPAAAAVTGGDITVAPTHVQSRRKYPNEEISDGGEYIP